MRRRSVRPWLLWRRRGSKRFRVQDRRNDLAWDLKRARFACPGSLEPLSGYFIAVVVKGEMALVAGDMAEEAYRKTKAQRALGPDAVLMSRREHVLMRDGGHGRGHKTFVNVRGKEREISVDLVSRGHGKDRDKADVGMSISVDDERVLQIQRLRWKFHDTEKVDLGGGDGVQPAHAVFIFRFELADIVGEERDSAEVKEKELLENAGRGGGAWAGYLEEMEARGLEQKQQQR
ncbi:hypothetical protein E2562_008864 [Oryza meyeriana var. granulata]|uniref:Uncharacterized protein n=1 Tax=Oryza meyeriana var. granulata TaxID=110450 RepID=A0A6G1D0X0_9ORYZ|nr:hypothetical protein E2562_008864 [Oryza meyeriana var. granulata]